ncbi:MAG: hypothetical protein FJZ56_05200 [Chlamydiae bacterium]|nr:hypothetical protein [Chlamydiota bacterium]
MQITNVCENYFNGFYEIANFSENDSCINSLALLKILSYFTVIIPLTFAAMYGISELCGRVSVEEELSDKDSRTQDLARQRGLGNSSRTSLTIDPAAAPQYSLSQILDTYYSYFKPQANEKNLIAYSNSEDFFRHAKTAKIYYNQDQMQASDAVRVIFQREPTNIAMVKNQYNSGRLQNLFGYAKGVYNDPDARKEDGSLFSEQPNTAAVYAETYLWPAPGIEQKIEIACLSLPAPALDSEAQPNYDYYMNHEEFVLDRYKQEMKFLFATIEKAVRDHHITAFGEKGIKRIVLSRFGQGAFLNSLTGDSRLLANGVYREQLQEFLQRTQDLEIRTVMSEYTRPSGQNCWHDDVIVGNILETAEEGDFIVNAWDPHSAPGNGNDNDRSFDGAMGMGAAILLTQTGWLNPHLRNEENAIGVS